MKLVVRGTFNVAGQDKSTRDAIVNLVPEQTEQTKNKKKKKKRNMYSAQLSGIRLSALPEWTFFVKVGLDATKL